MNKNILNETFLKAVDFIDELSLSCIADNIILSTICVMPFRMKKPLRLLPWLIHG